MKKIVFTLLLIIAVLPIFGQNADEFKFSLVPRRVASPSLTGYIKADGTVPLTANWPMGAFELSQATWKGVAIGAGYGGTGQSSYAVGDILYASGAGALSKLAAVATGQVLASAGTTTAPAWSANAVLGASDGSAGGTVTINPTLDAEINTGFSSWTPTAGWTFGLGVWTHSSGTTALADTQSALLVSGNTYKIVVGYTWAGAGSTISISIGGMSIPDISSASASSVTFYVKAKATTRFSVVPTTGFTGSINSLSIKLITNGTLVSEAITMNSGQLSLPMGNSTYPAIVFPNSTPGNGIYSDQYGNLYYNYAGTICFMMTGSSNSFRVGGNNTPNIGFGVNTVAPDCYFGREAAATFQLGADAASPVAQTLKACDTSAGTADTAGSTLTIAAGNSTGSGASTINFNTSGNTAASTVVNSSITRASLTTDGLTLNPTLGTEGIANFASWTPTTNWAYTTKWSHSTGSAVALTATGETAIVASTLYKVVITATTSTAGTGVVFSMGGVVRPAISTTGTFTYYIYTSTTDALAFTPGTGGTWVGSIDTISVKVDTNATLTADRININGPITTSATMPVLKFVGQEVHTSTLSGVGGNEVAFTLNYTTNKAAGNDTGLVINQTDTVSGGTSNLFDAQVGGVSQFKISNGGVVTTPAGVNCTDVYRSISTSGNIGFPSTATAGIEITRTSTVTSGSVYTLKILPTYNQASGTAENTDLLINRTETAIGSGIQRLISGQIGSVEKWGVDNRGAMVIGMTADAVLQVGMVAMVDAGTDERFDVNGVNNEAPIGIVTGSGPTAQGTAYGLATAGIAYVAPAEDVVSVTRGYVMFQDASDAGYADVGANVAASRHDYEIGHPIISEAAIAFDGAADVDPTANTIVLDSTPTWVVGDPVIFWDSGDTQPEGMVTGNVYWIKTIATATVTLSATRGGATLDITADGSGTTMYLMRLPKCMIHWN